MTTGARIGYSRALRFAPAIAWAGVIFAGSSLPGSSVPSRFSELGHFGEYSILGALVVLALLAPRGLPGRAMWIALAACALYAFSDELHQAFVPGRVPDVLDWTLDVVGSSTGIALAGWLAARRAAA